MERNGIQQRHSNEIVTGEGSVSGLACSRQSGMCRIRVRCVFSTVSIESLLLVLLVAMFGADPVDNIHAAMEGFAISYSEYLASNTDLQASWDIRKMGFIL